MVVKIGERGRRVSKEGVKEGVTVVAVHYNIIKRWTEDEEMMEDERRCEGANKQYDKQTHENFFSMLLLPKA